MPKAALDDALQLPISGILYDGRRVNTVAASPNGQLIASGDTSGLIKLEHRTQRVVATLHDGHGVASLAFSPRGGLLMSGDEAGAVTFWRASETLRPVASRTTRRLPGARDVFSVAFSPNGRVAASGDDAGNITLWNPASGAPVGPPLANGPNVFGVAFASAGRMLASGDGAGNVRLWSLTTRQAVSLPHDHSYVFSVAVAPHTDELAAADDAGHVVLWNMATHRLTGDLTPSPGSAVRDVAFSGDGRELASGDYAGKVTLWDVSTQQPAGPPIASGGTVFSVAFRPHDVGLVSADQAGDIVSRVPSPGRASPPLKDGPIVSSIAVSRSGSALEAATRPATWFSGMRTLTGVAGSPPTAATRSSA